ncbi:four helix bundle protein [bacterium]|nr:four helix bundle protein [bacterium]MCK4597133.1 four helix bundle protein [bacterium]
MGKNDLSDRLLDFSAKVIQIVDRFKKTAAGRHVGNQLMRSGTSAGANYEEACAAESRADFIHKLQLVLKELRESNYWLHLVAKTRLLPHNDRNLGVLIQESLELTNIMAKSIVTAKKRS